MRLTANKLRSIPLLLLTSLLASNPAIADDQRIHIESSSTSTTMQFCGTEDTCQFIQFSAVNNKEPRPRQANTTQSQDPKSSLIDKINTQLFGF